MKTFFYFIFIIFPVLTFSQDKKTIDKPFIEVSGQADTLVMPNRIWISVILTEKDSKGKKSVEDLEKAMIQKLQEIGIDVENNLSMTDMSSNFQNYFLKQTDILKAKSYSILTTDAKTTSKVFIELEKIDISNVRIEKIENSEEKKIQLLINGKAMESAKKIAESFVKPLNQKIGNALQISNFEDISNQLAGRVNGIQIRGAKSIRYYDQSESKQPSVEFKKIKISSTVQVRFLLE
ncbi:DUF541 domain-containing protein [Flavobacterium sp. GA093]|uniref:DUF541 domain-containing protein n=1 Tax=Flavobacterium hydrocarbonoxydans TaxID=2683249 RepID=A0A6I4NZD4_9FLAO|nr:SIMPL domain-containing protein [Flavobacterium hydrocarbonoxydans]MWB96427.1 DUF541 domain-containing protein [Flavobacterium hydrocarbonoxydans]